MNTSEWDPNTCFFVSLFLKQTPDHIFLYVTSQLFTTAWFFTELYRLNVTDNRDDSKTLKHVRDYSMGMVCVIETVERKIMIQEYKG